MHWPLPKMSTISLHHRLATRDDIAALTALMNAAIGELQKPFLTDAQIASAGRSWVSILSSLTMEPISSSNKMALLLVAADGVGGQPSMGATVHPGAMQRRLTRRRMPRACVLCIRTPTSPAEGWGA